MGARHMPLRKHRLSSLTFRLALLSLAAVCLAVLRPSGRARVEGLRPLKSKRRSGLRRAAVSLSFATLFFAGAAFSAGAGDLLVEAVEGQHAAALAPAASDAECQSSRQSDWDAEDSTDGCVEGGAEASAEATADPAAEEAAAPAEPAVEAAQEAAPETASPETASPETAAPSTTAAIAAAAGNVLSQASQPSPNQSSSSSLTNAVRNRAAPARRDPAPAVIEAQSADRTHKHEVHPDPEVELPGTAATIWLHRALPDPTPPSKRLTKPFARNLRYASARHKVHWSLVLGVLRARGERGSVPATKRGLNRLAENLSRLGARKDEWNATLALEGRTAFADRTVALARYHRAVGLKALVRGLRWARPLLAKRLLNDDRV
ncbi:MAG: hypothetical protein ACRDMK_04495, partial [Gaiellaceae bacterium]